MDSRRSYAYRLLGIPADSDREAVARAYHRLARATHPDVSADPNAAERFAALTAAYRLAAEAPRAGLTTDTREQVPTAERWEPDDRPAAPAWVWVDETRAPGSTAAAATRRRRPPIVAGPVRFRPTQSPSGGASWSS